MVVAPAGDGGVQSLHWAEALLQMDEDGDAAHAFLVCDAGPTSEPPPASPPASPPAPGTVLRPHSPPLPLPAASRRRLPPPSAASAGISSLLPGLYKVLGAGGGGAV